MEGVEPVESDKTDNVAVERLRGAAAVRAHATLLLGLALCAVAFWFEIGRAERGNSLSWAYVFEWPLLGAFAVYMWWKVLHPTSESRAKAKAKAPALAPEFSGMLAAWEQYQHDLVISQQTTSARGDDDEGGLGE